MWSLLWPLKMSRPDCIWMREPAAPHTIPALGSELQAEIWEVMFRAALKVIPSSVEVFCQSVFSAYGSLFGMAWYWKTRALVLRSQIATPTPVPSSETKRNGPQEAPLSSDSASTMRVCRKSSLRPSDEEALKRLGATVRGNGSRFFCVASGRRFPPPAGRCVSCSASYYDGAGVGHVVFSAFRREFKLIKLHRSLVIYRSIQHAQVKRAAGS